MPSTSLGNMSLVNWMRWKLQSERARQRLRQGGLAHSGHPFDQQVSTREQRDQGEADDLILAPNDGA